LRASTGQPAAISQFKLAGIVVEHTAMTIEASDTVAAMKVSTSPETSMAGIGASPTQRRPERWRPSLWRLVRWTLLAGLLGLNAWWYWRDIQPKVGLDTISRLIEQHHDREAEESVRGYLARSPHDGEARIMLAKLLAQRNDVLGSAQELHKVPFWWPDKGKWLLMEGGAFKEFNRMADAEAAWKAVVEDDALHPVDPKFVTAAMRDLLELYAIEGRWDDAVRLIWTIYERTSDLEEREALLNMRIRTELERILPAVAVAKMEKYLAAEPADWEARRGLAKAQMALNQVDEARRNLSACVEERPDNPRGWADYLDFLHDTGDLDGLREAVARLPKAVAEHAGVLKHRALLLERDRQWAQAAELYHRILLLRPAERETIYRLSLIEDRLGQHDAAQVHRERAQAMRTARTELTEAYQKIRDLHESDPNSPKYHAAIRRLAQLCEVLGWNRDAEGWNRLVPIE
jgi:tetratricopeptide (TPR) repeat protein